MGVGLRLPGVGVGWRGSIAPCLGLMSFVGLAAVVVVPFAPFVELLCQDGAWNGRCMVEDQSTSVIGGNKEDAESAERQDQHQRPFTASHSALPEDAPQGEHSKHSQGGQRQFLMSLHQLMHRLAMRDVFICLEP